MSWWHLNFYRTTGIKKKQKKQLTGNLPFQDKMLIPKLNKFQAIPKKKYRVISEDPQTCVKPFPWKPGVKKTSLENWKTNTRWSSRIRCVSSEIIYANYGELGVSPLWVTPLAYRNVIIKRLIIIQECHSLQKNKKNLVALKYSCLYCYKTGFCHMMQIIYLDKWKTIAVRIETFISDTAHDPIKTSLSPN